MNKRTGTNQKNKKQQPFQATFEILSYQGNEAGHMPDIQP